MLGIAGHLLPRPFSISDAGTDGDGEAFAEFLYKPIGRVTRAMTQLGAGERIRVLGPLGNGFPDPEVGRRPLLLAGGIGNAPFALQVRELIRRGVSDPENIILFLAARTADELWIQDSVIQSGVQIVPVTDDGSKGEKGFITDAVSRRLDELGPVEIFACGPQGMLTAVRKLALERALPAHLSVEEHMACGYGVCNACVVERCREGEAQGSGPYARVCVDGPVFRAEEIYPDAAH